MIKFTMWRGLGQYLLMLLLLGMGTQFAQAQTGGGGEATIADLLKKHDDAMARQDLDAVLVLYAPGAKTVLLGTGPGERYQGLDEIKNAYTEFFKDYDKGTTARDCYWKNGGSSETVAWGGAMCKFSDSKGGQKREYELNVSAVVQRVGGKWQFVMIHYSNLTSGGTPPPAQPSADGGPSRTPQVWRQSFVHPFPESRQEAQ